MIGKLLKYSAYFLTGLVLLLGVLILFSQTRLFKNWLRTTLIQQANANLNAQLFLGAIQGNVLNDFEISDLCLQSTADTVIDIERIRVNFAPMRLIRKQVLVQVLSLHAPCVRLKQLPDSSWNLAHLVKSTKKSDSTAPLEWRFRFENVQLSRGWVRILPLAQSRFLPGHIRDIEARLSMEMRQDTVRARLRQFSLRSLQPELRIRELAFDFNLQAGRMQFRNLKLATEKSTLTGLASLALAPADSAALVLQARPIDFSEIREFIPDLPPIQPLDLNLTIDYRADTVRLAGTTALKGQSVRLFGQADRLDEHPNYTLSANLDQVQLSDWIANPALDYLFNGQIRLNGAGTTWKDAVLHLESELSQCQVFDRRVHSAQLTADYRSGLVSSQATIHSPFGGLTLAGWLSLSGSRRFRLSAEGDKIDLAPLFLNDSLKSEINFHLLCQGQGVELHRLNAEADLHLIRSRLLRLPVDTLFTRVRAHQGTLFIDTLYAMTSPASVHGSGTVGAELDYHLKLYGDFSALDWLKALIPADSLNGSGRMQARIDGRKDSLVAETRFDFHRIFYNTLQADSVAGNFYVIYQDSLNGSAQAHLKNIKFSEFPMDQITIQSIIRPSSYRFFVDFNQSRDVNGHFEALLQPDSVTTLHLPELLVNIKNNPWTGDSAGVVLSFAPERYWVHNACLHSGEQLIRLYGLLAQTEENDLTLEISKLNLEPFLGLIPGPLLQQAILDLDAHLRGTMSMPELGGVLSLSSGRLKGVDFDLLKAKFDYLDRQLNWQLRLRQNTRRGLESEGFVPIDLALAETRQRLIYEKPLQVRIVLDTLDLQTLEPFSDQIRIQGGKAFGQLLIENTLENIRPIGEFIVSGAELKLPAYGVDYKDMHMTVKVDSTHIYLQNLRTKSERGYLAATGVLDFDRNILNGEFKSTQVKLVADQFTVVNSRDYQATLGADLQLTGPVRTPQLNGTIQVLRSRWYLPAFMAGNASEDEWAQPMLVQAQPDTGAAKELAAELSLPDMLDNLKVNASIEISKNTWLKSPEINLEIAGELTVIKRQQANFELFGTIRVLRGAYNLYGKRFVINKGNLSFEGGPDFNPGLELEASHVFRAANTEKKSLTLLLSGKALNPIIKFTLDGSEISEGNAIAYLVLGRSLEELTHSERSTLAQESGFNPGSAASNILTSLVANEVSKLIGSKLNLDVIEFKGEENWQQATFVIGKYLTNDLFFSYQKEFSTSQTNEIVPMQVTLEYEINRNLFLQLTKGSEKNTGFDLIFKLQK